MSKFHHRSILFVSFLFCFCSLSFAQSPTLHYSTAGKIETAVSGSLFSMSPETHPTDIEFNSDGTKMYISGLGLDNVYEYNLSLPYTISGATISDTLSVVAQESSITGISFSSDGSKMFILGTLNDSVYQYNLSNYFLSSAIYSGIAFAVPEDTSPADVTFSNDGFKMFVLGSSTDNVYEYILSSAYDLTTATYSGNSFSIAAQETGPTGLSFNADGSKMFIIGSGTDKISRYDLSTNFDILTSAFSGVSISVNPEDASPEGIAFSRDGTQLFMVGSANDIVNEYILSNEAFIESSANDGSVFGSIIFTLKGEYFNNPGGTLTNGIDYLISNLPSGLTPNVTVSADSASAVLTLLGTSISHDFFDSAPDLQFTFEDGAFYFGNAVNVANSQSANSGLAVDFDRNLTPSITYSAAGEIGTASFLNSRGISGQANLATGIAFNGDGSKLYVLDSQDDNVTEFILSSNYDISTPTIGETFNLTLEETSPSGIAFNPSGSRMYISGFGNDQVYEYKLATSFDVSTASYTGNVIAITEDSTPSDLTFSKDGYSLFVIGSGTDAVYEYALSAAFDLSTAVYSGNSFSVSAEETGPTSILFNSNGTRMFVLGTSSDRVFQYNLSIGYDLSTAIFSGISVGVAEQDGTPQGLAMDSTGTKLFFVGQLLDRVYEYGLSGNAFFESSANDGAVEGELIMSITGDTFINPGGTLTEVTDYAISNLPSGLSPSIEVSLDGLTGLLTLGGTTTFNDDLDDVNNIEFFFEDVAFGSGLGEVIQNASPGNSNLNIDFTANPLSELSYSIASDVSTAVYSNSFSVSTEDTSPTGLTFNNDGSKLYITGRANNNVLEYSLSLNYDISSAILSHSLNILFEESGISGIEFNTTGTRMYLIGFGDDKVNEYLLQSPFDLSTASFSGKTLSVLPEDNSPSDLAFSNDGTRLFVLGSAADHVIEYNVSSPFDVSTATYSGNSFAIGTEETSPAGLAFNAIGTQMFVIGSGSDRVFQYNLGTAFDLNSVQYTRKVLSVVDKDLTSEGLTFSHDGEELFILGSSTDSVYSYYLSPNAFIEKGSNTGEVEGQLLIELAGDVFANQGGTLTHSTDYTIDNLPAGLVPNLAVDANGNSAMLTFSGGAVSNDDLDDVFDIQMTFENTAFLGGDATVVANAVGGSSNFAIDFGANLTPEITYSQQVHIGGFGFNTSLDTSSEDGIMSGLVFNNDGSKLFVLGVENDRIYEYSLGTSYDINSAELITVRYVGFEDGTPTGIVFNKNGTRLFMIGLDNDLIHEYYLSSPFDIGVNSLSYTGKTFDVSGEETSPSGLTFSSEGDKLYVIGTTADAVIEYDLSMPYELNTAVFTSSFDLSAYESSPRDVQFNANGTKMITLGAGTDKILSFSLGTPFDVSTATFDGIEKSIASYSITPEGLALNAEGTQFFIVGSSFDNISSFGLTQDAFVENGLNEGGLEGELLVSIAGEIFESAGSTLIHESDYIINNLPFGLVPSLTVNPSGTGATLVLDGNAQLNDDLDDVGDIQITFENTAFVGGDASLVANAIAGSSGLAINFFDNPIPEVKYSSPLALGTMVFNSSFDVSGEDNIMSALAFNNDGSKVFLTGASNDSIYEYSLGIAYDITTASYTHSEYIGFEDATPTGIAFNKDGSRLFMIGLDNDKVHEYLLRFPFDIGFGSFVYTGESLNISAQETSPSDLTFSADGSKLFVVGSTSDGVHEYNLTEPYEIASAVFTQSFGVGTEDTSPLSVRFNANGTKMIVLGNGGDKIYGYDLSIGFDLSTASHNGIVMSIATQETSPEGFALNNNGTMLFMVGSQNDNINSYHLTSDVFSEVGANNGAIEGELIISLANSLFENSGGSLTHLTDYTIDNLPNGLTPDLAVSGDGITATLGFSGAALLHDDADDITDIQITFANTAFVNGDASLVANAVGGSSNLGFNFSANLLPEVSYSSLVNLGTAVYTHQLDVSAEDNTMSGIVFNNDGTKLFTTGATNDRIYQYDLTVGYDLSSATLSASRLIQFEENTPTGLVFNKEGSRLFVIGLNSDKIHEYLLKTPFDISEGSLSYTGNSFDVSAQETSPSDMQFNGDGTKMYVLGSTGDNVYEYNLSIPYDLKSAVHVNSFDVSLQDGAPVGLAFNANGTNMFILGAGGDKVYGYSLSTGYDLATALYNEIEISIGAQDISPEGLTFSVDGTKLFIVGVTSDNVFSYNLSSVAFTETSANDGAVEGGLIINLIGDLFENPGSSLINSTDYSIVNLPVGLIPSLDIAPNATQAILKLDGNALDNDEVDDLLDLQITFENSAFVGGDASAINNAIGGSSNLSIDFAPDLESEVFYSGTPLISRAELINSFNVAVEESNATALLFNKDGSRMFVIGTANDNITQYDLVSPFDVSTAALVSSLNISFEEEFPTGMAFNATGSRLFTVGFGDDQVDEYVLPVPFDIDGAYYSGNSIGVDAEDSSPVDIAFSADGLKMFMIGSISDAIHEYQLGVPFDIKTAVSSGNSLNIASETSTPTGIAFSADGYTILVTGSNDYIFQYDLTSPFDITTAAFSTIEINVSGEDNNPEGITMSRDGSILYMIGSVSDQVYQYDLNTSSFVESGSNDGSVEGLLNINLVGDLFESGGSSLLVDSDYTIDNLPGGLEPDIFVDPSGTSATLFLFGNALEHTDLDDLSDIQITFQNSAFVGGNASLIGNTTVGSSGFGIDFSENLLSKLSYSTIGEISEASLVASFGISTEDNSATDLAFNDDGSKVFMSGQSTDHIYEYSLGINFDIATASLVDSLNIETVEGIVSGISFNASGSRLYTVGSSAAEIREFVLPTLFTLSGASYSGKHFDVGSEDSSPTDIDFSPDGTILFMVGNTNNAIFQYDLGVPFDISTAIYSTVSFSVTTEDSSPAGIDFNADGSKMVLIGANDFIYQYDLLSNNDIGTASYSGLSFSISDDDISPEGISYDNSGTKLFIMGRSSGRIIEYALSDSVFTESSSNDGTVDGQLLISLIGDHFNGAGGDLVETSDYAIGNLPGGLVPSISVSSDGLSAVLTFSGNATNHNEEDDLANLEINFENNAFASNNASSIINAIGGSTGFGIDFTVNPPLTEITLSTISLSDEEIIQGTTDQLIYKFSYAISGGDITSTGLSFLLEGSFADTDFEINGFELRYNTSEDVLEDALSLGFSSYDPGDPAPPNSIGWPMTETLFDGQTIFFYVTADISPTATVGNMFNVVLPTLENFGFEELSDKIDETLLAGQVFTIQSSDTQAPIITVNQLTTSIRKPALSGEIDDPAATIEIELNSTVYSAINNEDGTWVLPEGSIVEDLVDGTYDIIATGTDASNNVGVDGTTNELTISTDVVALAATEVTSTSFEANWSLGVDPKEYRVDVSQTSDFSTFLSGYQDISVGTSIGVLVSPVDFNTTYFYRVRLVSQDDQVSDNSNIVSVKTGIDQETISDSTALVQIYNSLGGSDWTTTVNWETARLREWDRVLLDNTQTRVEDVDISGLGAVGDMPNPFTGDAVGGLSAMLEMDVSNNEITGLMDFSGKSITNLNVSGNNLQFDDLEPIVGITTLDYSNQSSLPFNETVDGVDSILVNHTEDFLLSTNVGGSQNSYQWQRNGSAIASGEDYAITGSNANILSIDYDNMGEFSVAVSNALVPGLTINIDPQLVLAIADLNISVLGTDGMPISENLTNAYLLEAFRRAKGFDTLVSVSNVSSEFSFPDLVLGNYLAAVDSDPEKYIATYFGDEFLWDEADTIFFRNSGAQEINIQVIPPPRNPEDQGKVSGTVDEDFPEDEGRIDARRRAARRKCGLRRQRTGGRTGAEDDGFELIAYGETNENGEFEYGQLSEGTYRFFVEYPGIPLDPDAFVQFEVGEAGISQNEFVLAATVTENGIQVELIKSLGVIHRYFKNLQIYPNPSREMLNISYRHLTTDAVRMELHNLAGTMLLSRDLERGYDRDLHVDVSDYEEGIYLLRFYDKESREKNMMTYRIIVRDK